MKRLRGKRAALGKRECCAGVPLTLKYAAIFGSKLSALTLISSNRALRHVEGGTRDREGGGRGGRVEDDARKALRSS